MNSNQQKALNSAKRRFNYLRNHPIIQKYRKKIVEDYGFYDGDKQWDESVKSLFKEYNIPIITINKIKNLVNHMSGMEIQTRFRIAFKSHNLEEQSTKLAEAITHLSYSIQERQEMAYKSSLKFKDTLITGLGWSNIYKEPKSGEIVYERVHPSDILFDADDASPNLDNMGCVCRIRWVSLAEAIDLWPSKKAKFKEMFDTDGIGSVGNKSQEIDYRQDLDSFTFATGNGSIGSRIALIEVQHKESKKSFKGLDRSGRNFNTFNLDEAEMLIHPDYEIEETNSIIIMRSVFTDDILLEYAPLEPQIPNLTDFSYIPCVWSRRNSDGVPDGWIDVMKEVQREINYRRSKMVQAINSNRIIADSTVLGDSTDLEKFRAEIKRPDAVLITPPDARLDIKSNMDIANGQFHLLNKGDEELQQVSGIYDEALGKQTNAASGVAIQQRQINSVRNQVFAFDNLRLLKKREARMMLALIQGGGDTNLASEVFNDGERELFILNISREVDGRNVFFNDIRSLPLSIYVEEVPDFESSAQEQRATIERLLQNPNAPLLMQSPLFLKRLGIRDYDNIAQEFIEINQAQNAAKQDITPEMLGDVGNGDPQEQGDINAEQDSLREPQLDNNSYQ